jgi:hypothetical protein
MTVEQMHEPNTRMIRELSAHEDDSGAAMLTLNVAHISIVVLDKMSNFGNLEMEEWEVWVVMQFTQIPVSRNISSICRSRTILP